MLSRAVMVLLVSIFGVGLCQDGCAVRHAFYQSFREDFDIMKEAAVVETNPKSEGVSLGTYASHAMELLLTLCGM